MVVLEKHESIVSYKVRTIDLPATIEMFSWDYKHDVAWSWSKVLGVSLDSGEEPFKGIYKEKYSIIILLSGGNGVGSTFVRALDRGVLLKKE